LQDIAHRLWLCGARREQDDQCEANRNDKMMTVFSKGSDSDVHSSCFTYNCFAV
jgi:hypothetical protein